MASDRNKLRLQCTAYHEAGHHVLKWRLGIRLGKVTIKPDHKKGELGVSESHRPAFKKETIKKMCEDKKTTPGQTRRIENQIMVCLAGREAERIFRTKKRGLCGEPQDYEQAQNLLSILVDVISPQYRVYWKLLLLRTEDILSTPPVWCAVKGLAEALLKKETLTGKEAMEVIIKGITNGAKRKNKGLPLQRGKHGK